METKRANLTLLLLLAAVVLYDFLINPHLPAVIPRHWNIYGQADGFSPKETVYFLSLLPLLLVALVINLLPRLPVSAGMNPSVAIGNYISVGTAILLCYVDGLGLQAALHPGLSMTKPIMTGMLLLFILLGNVLGKTRRNPWSGIRTPWTLASGTNWIATHRFAGRLWVGVSLIGIILLWLDVSLAVLLPAVFLLLAGLPCLYSYLLSRRAQENGEGSA